MWGEGGGGGGGGGGGVLAGRVGGVGGNTHRGMATGVDASWQQGGLKQHVCVRMYVCMCAVTSTLSSCLLHTSDAADE